MNKPLRNANISLKLRFATATAALAYTNALIEFGINSPTTQAAHRELISLSDDVQLCLRAIELNKEWDE